MRAELRVLCAACLLSAGALVPASLAVQPPSPDPIPQGLELLAMVQEAADPAAPLARGPGLFGVRVLDESWRDDARNGLEVHVRVRIPVAPDVRPAPDGASAAGGPPAGGLVARFPVVVISTALGGTRVDLSYLGERLASRGFVCVHVQHPGSDLDAVKKPTPGRALWAVAEEPANRLNRPLDVSFVLDRIGAHPELAGRVDMERVGVVGYEFGAYAALVAAGLRARVPDGADGADLADPRVRCAVAMSPPGNGVLGIAPAAWGEVRVPVLMLTGSRDSGPSGQDAFWRQQGFDTLTAAPKVVLVSLADADRVTYGPGAEPRKGWSPLQRNARAAAAQGAHTEAALEIVTVFLRAVLHGDPDAQAWLDGAGLERSAGAASEVRRRGTGAWP